MKLAILACSLLPALAAVPAASADSAGLVAARQSFDALAKGEVEEARITIDVKGQKVVGTLATPKGKAPAPVVLLLHGFTGTRDEMPLTDIGEGVFSRAARLWAERGYASLRIDFRGSGESEGAWADTTFDGQIEDALAALAYLKSEKRVAGERVAVVGWSQGGLVATAVAGRTPELRAVGLWAPVVNPPLTYTALFGPETMRTAPSAKAPVKATILGTAETTMNSPFFQGVYGIDPVAEMARYEGPLFVAVGTKDEIVAPQPAMGALLLKYHEGPEELWVRDMDHEFNGTKTLEFVDEMAPTTIGFLAEYLK